MASERLVGAWRMVGYEFKTADGGVRYPWGEDAEGLVIFEPGGHMSAQIMRPDRPHVPAPGASDDAPPEVAVAYRGYLAYFGKYEVDEAAGTVTTRVHGSLNPAWVGGDQLRMFELDGDRLTLRTPSMGPGGVNGVLRWERIA